VNNKNILASTVYFDVLAIFITGKIYTFSFCLYEYKGKKLNIYK